MMKKMIVIQTETMSEDIEIEEDEIGLTHSLEKRNSPRDNRIYRRRPLLHR